jgi:hypothetical protein
MDNELARLLQQATPGPWLVVWDEHGNNPRIEGDHITAPDGTIWSGPAIPACDADAELIIYLRNRL